MFSHFPYWPFGPSSSSFSVRGDVIGKGLLGIKEKLDGSREKHRNSSIPQYRKIISHFPMGQEGEFPAPLF
jgi:hypothetical protein